jgi:hypothetical protein
MSTTRETPSGYAGMGEQTHGPVEAVFACSTQEIPAFDRVPQVDTGPEALRKRLHALVRIVRDIH